MALFESSLKPKLIYVFAIKDDKHKGCLKIGETTLDGDNAMAEPNSNPLNQAAKARINQYTQTAGIDYQLLYTERTLYYNKETKTIGSFNDKQVHTVLERSGIKRAAFDGQGTEWYRTDLETVKNAIAAVKAGRSSLNNSEITQDQTPILFRPEQQEAIKKTLKKFKQGNRMLWNAKMRFGKTLCALHVVKEMQLTRTLILTHRPAVNEGWFEDFRKIFYDSPLYHFGSKSKGETLANMEKMVTSGEGKYIYFASMQDLRGSETVGGNFDKNDEVFSCSWDLIIVDEAHEGTQTQLGQNVMNELTKRNTKVLQLSGTPFNLINQYTEDEVYTWDYTMEQKAKAAWDRIHFGDSNPYAGLPTMNIYTYDLGNLLTLYADKEVAFNFTEFLRVKDDETFTFVHQQDVQNFLNLLTQEDKESCYPFANKEYRNYFKHTLWMVPGVRAAKALSNLLQKHPVFSQFGIVNVAGNGDEEIDTRDALKAVQKAIQENEYTITLSCGRLTTGVTIPEWTAVLMISGSYSTAASAYMQTIFRVQSPWEHEGKRKETCYVFDFAPDRTLKVIAETAKVSAKAGQTSENDRKVLGDFLNFCPVISYKGSQMQEKITADKLFTELKKVYVERVVRSGFEDNSLYSDELLKMNDLALQEFENLKNIIGTTKAIPKPKDIDLNNTGLTDEEYEERKQLQKKKKKDLTEEDKKRLEELNEAKKNRSKAISILRGISIRMPLLIYGTKLDGDIKDITLENFASLIDDASWEEFMPKGITKSVFATYTKYYDQDIFIEAGRRIRAIAESADKMSVEQRIECITALFSNFRNPDKETVLTPWRVVNMHMGDCLGGYNFYDETYSETISEPRLIEQGNITANVFHANAHILEINSKTGLYPLYVAYSIYRAKVKNQLTSPETIEEQQKIWDSVIKDNVFVLCKTKMAQSITKRTLVGFRKAKTNTHAFDDLINQITNKQTELIEKINKGQLFKNFKDMKFDAVVGNPPYQLAGHGQKELPIYQHFVDISIKLAPSFISMIIPSRWYTASDLKEFRKQIISSKKIHILHDFTDARLCFIGVEIKGGICYFLWEKSYQGACSMFTHSTDTITLSERNFTAESTEIIIRDKDVSNIVNHITKQTKETFDSLISSNDPFGFDIREDHSSKRMKVPFSLSPIPNGVKFYYNGWKKEGIGFVAPTLIRKNKDWVKMYKVLIPKAWGTGKTKTDRLNPFIVEPNSCCTETYLVIGPFETKKECQNVITYIQSKFFHFLVSVMKNTQNSMQGNYIFVPLQNFNKPWTDKELYTKYNLSKDEIEYIENMIKWF